MPNFVELVCYISPRSDLPIENGQGYCRPRLAEGVELTPATSIDDVREIFGPPKSEWDSPADKTLTLIYLWGRFHMEFEFETPAGRLLTWTIPL